MALVVRRALTAVRAALADTRVVVVVGARQAGKSTLARQLMRATPNARERRLDEPGELAAARADPVGFVRHEGLLVVDEVQRAPELLLPIKAIIDDDPAPGRFLLTGSARLLGLRSLPDALVGRTETIELWPFSQGEIDQTPDSFVEEAFGAVDPDEAFSRFRSWGTDPIADTMIERVVRGGFPEAVVRTEGRRRRFFTAYINDLVDRDVTQLADITRRDDLHRLLRALAARTAQLLPVNGLAEELGMAATTVKRYVSLFEEVFLVRRLAAFFPAGATRATRQQKLIFVDTGIAAHLRGHGTARLARDRVSLGPLVENLLLGELARQVALSDEVLSLRHYRTRDGAEVDGVIEHADGRVVGVEVKAAETVRASDFGHLRHLQRRLGDRMLLGVVLHLGQTVASFGPGLWALPADVVWRGAHSRPGGPVKTGAGTQP
ncbi:MAG: ATP-binding protein [Acidimicrobiales bacterium]